MTRRDLGKSSRETVAIKDFIETVSQRLDSMQHDMLVAVQERNKKMIHDVANLDELDSALACGKIGFFRIKYTETQNERFDTLMEKYKITRRCLDDKDPNFVFVAKSY